MTISVCRRCGETNTRGRCSRCDNLDALGKAAEADGDVMKRANKSLDWLELSYGIAKGDVGMVDIAKRVELSLTGEGWYITKSDAKRLTASRADRILELGLANNRDAAWAKALLETVDPYQPRSDENPRLGDLWSEAPDDEHTAQRDRRRREQARVDGEELSARARDLKTRRKAQGVDMSLADATIEVAKNDQTFRATYERDFGVAPLRKRNV